MKRKTLLARWLRLSTLIFPLACGGHVWAASYSVTNTNNLGVGSLRQAIVDANGNSGSDTITFSIGTGVQTIFLTAPLPAIDDPVLLDGWSQPGHVNVPIIRIDGQSAGGGANGLTLANGSDGSTIRGLMLTRFSNDGILIQSGADGVTVGGNWLGTNGSGATSMGNGRDGIEVFSAGNRIGDTGANDRNVIVNNSNEGVNVSGSSATDNEIYGNYIGLEPDGASGAGNGDVGIAILSGAHRTIVGDGSAAGRNVISMNFEGIEISSNDNIVQGNYFGTDSNGTLDRGQTGSDAVELVGGADDNLITANLIAFTKSGRHGVSVQAGTGNAVLGNRIHSNTGLGINLDPSGVTANNGTKSGGLPNSEMDFPVFTSASLSGTTLTVAGYVGSAPGQSLFANARVEIFESDDDPSGNGEGRTYFDFLTTDANGNFSGSVTVSGLTAGENITGTATDTSNNTSEFGGNFPVSGPPGPTVCKVDSAGTYIDAENFTGTILQGATFSLLTTIPGYVGSGYLFSNGGGTVAPPVNEGKQYQLDFDTPGTYNVWMRGYATSGSTDSLFIGLGGVDVGALNENGVYNQWVWSNSIQTGVNTIVIPSAGTYTFNIWIREASHAVDGLYLTLGAETPSGGIPTGKAQLDPTNCNFKIRGTVFEDVNYGGGAGRSQIAAAGVGRPAARVELFDTAGNFVTATSSDASGDYEFTVGSGDHVVRVVSASVSSSRPGAPAGLWPVQTLVTDASSGTAIADVNRVGGEVPGIQDAGNAVGGTIMNPATGVFTSGLSGQAQSITHVTVGAGDVSDLDFGFNFDTIVNTNDLGQGSFRQFILNANGLGNAGLNQAGLTAGIDNAIFMLADGTARPGITAAYVSQFVAGVATIQPNPGQLEDVTDPVILDATLQPGYLGTPIVELDGTSAGPGADGLTLSAGGSTVHGLAIRNFGGSGILVENPGGNTIGATGAGNLIFDNGDAGVRVEAGSGNAINANSIYANAGLGIDLGPGNTVDANDGVVGAGPNDGMDYPVLTIAMLSGGSLRIEGFVGTPSTKIAGTHNVQLFKVDNNPADQDGEVVSGDLQSVPHGEGRWYLGSCSSAADGTIVCDVVVPGTVTLAPGDSVVATATDGASNTSEFGANATVSPMGLVKRAFQLNGTPIPNGSTLPLGVPFRFLIYLNNTGGGVLDVSIEDTLVSQFAYVANSIRFDNSLPSCTLLNCTTAEEVAVFNAADAGAAASDATSLGDPVGVVGTTIYAGDQSVGNGQLDIAANKVWAIVFTVNFP